MATRMQQRRGTAAQWISINSGNGPILNAGEIGYESDTNKFKIGDGTSYWINLDYFIDANSTVNPSFGSSITFEGATANAFETTLEVTDPTADRTITFPDAAGTVQLRVTNVDDTEIGYLNGVTSAIQTQLNAKIAKTDITAKGAILVGTGSGTYTAQTVGTNGQVLTANSAQADGVEWTTVSGYSAPTLGSTSIGSGATVTNITGLTLTTSTVAADPTTALGIVSKQYVDAVTTGINFHTPVKAASVTNLAVTYNNGTSGVGATLTADTLRAFNTLDGQAVSVGERVLIKDQTTQLQNGIYTLTNNGSAGVTAWILTRATDNDNNPGGEMSNGDIVNATGGTVNSGKTFVNTTTGTITIGTTAITFGNYYAGLPAQTGSAGLALTTDGTTPSWSSTINGTAIPSTKTLVVTTDKLSVHAVTSSAELVSVISDETGSGSLVFGTSPTITPAAGTTATATTGAGYMGLPQNSTTTGAYTIAAADAGKHIYSTATRTITIDSNANLALPIGTTLTFISGVGATTTIAITTDTMNLAGTGTTGSRTLAAYGIATAIKIASTTWIISGNGLT